MNLISKFFSLSQKINFLRPWKDFATTNIFFNLDDKGDNNPNCFSKNSIGTFI